MLEGARSFRLASSLAEVSVVAGMWCCRASVHAPINTSLITIQQRTKLDLTNLVIVGVSYASVAVVNNCGEIY